ncbi:MAG TPA: hypothetical protein VMH05_18770 [Bryobacteraceae bacterium]|nr:hypothetical protein [Bryobacteraceae bacterium]
MALFRLHAWQLAASLIIVCALAVTAVYMFRLRGGSKPSDLVAYLPAENATVLYIDVDAIRRSGILNLVAGSKAAEEIEYKQFVDATLFDYRQDLDAVAAAFKDNQVFFAVRGRFHWKNLMDYARHQGGYCRNGFCVTSGSRPNRRISFYALRRDMMAMAISSDDFAAYQVASKPASRPVSSPSEPVWAMVPIAALQRADDLPSGLKPFARALGNAEQIVFTLGPEGDHLQLALNVTCRDTQTASALVVDLEGTTNELRKMLDREHQKPDPADLTGMLVAGSFRRDDRSVHGQWPLDRAFVDALANGSN